MDWSLCHARLPINIIKLWDDRDIVSMVTDPSLDAAVTMVTDPPSPDTTVSRELMHPQKHDSEINDKVRTKTIDGASLLFTFPEQ